MDGLLWVIDQLGRNLREATEELEKLKAVLAAINSQQ